MFDLSVACFGCEPCIHVCLLIVVTFSAIARTKSVRRKERSLNTRKKETRDKPTKASHLFDAYLNPIIVLCIAYSYSLIDALFYIAINL
jgi:hypothetical protein